MVEQLRLPFPLLSDPDREAAIRPYGLADDKDPRNLAVPAMVLITTEGEEAWRFVSRDYADRLAEDELIETLRRAELTPAAAEPLEIGPAVPGPNAMPSDLLYTYFRGARFAVVALAHRRPEIQQEADDYIVQMDRYMDNARRLFKEKKRAQAESKN